MFQLGKTIFKHDKVKIVKLSLQQQYYRLETPTQMLGVHQKSPNFSGQFSFDYQNSEHTS